MTALNLIPQTRQTLLETERLILRRYNRDDLDRLDRLNSNVEVMRYIGDGSLRTREQTLASIIRTQRVYELFPGLGFWIAEEKPKRKFVGVFALIYIPQTVEVEVGYRLAKSAWGRGLATEGASALVRYGILELGLDRVVGLTHPDNAASQNVLMKSGSSDGAWDTITTGTFVTLSRTVRDSHSNRRLRKRPRPETHRP